MERFTGVCKWWSDLKGYGFLTVEGEPDVFVHHSGIVGTGYKTLIEGQSVEFTVVQQDDRGPKATEVIILDTEDVQGEALRQAFG